MSDDVKQAVDGLMTAFEEFKKTNDERLKDLESKGAADPVTVEKLDKINKSLDQFEGINQKLTRAEQERQQEKEAREAAEAESKGRLDKIETILNRPGAGGADQQKDERKQAINAWARAVYKAVTVGQQNLTPDEQKALTHVGLDGKAMTVANDVTGGYLAPLDYVRDIIKGVTDVSAFRPLVRIRQTAGRGIMAPKRTGQFAAVRTTEHGTRSETTGLTYGMEEIVAPEMYALIDISQQNLEDSAFDLEAEIRMEATEQFAVKEGSEFCDGSGVGEIEGILTNSDVSSTNSGSAASIEDTDGTADGLITLQHAIKTAYARNASWVLNRQTIGAVRKLKDTNGQYIWMPGLALGVPNTILGDPYTELPDMPAVAANAFPIAYGDWRRAFTLVDRIEMSMLRDPYTQATSGNIRFLFRRRVGGQIVLAEAIRKLKCAT